MKYKLINSVTKIETICDKVTIDGFDYYVSDTEQIKWRDFVYNKETNGYFRRNINAPLESNEIYFKVIATNNSNIDVPKVVDEVEEITKDERYSNSFRIGFKHGYNKSQETHPFSDEDMIEFADWISKEFNISNGIGWWHSHESIEDISTKELLQLWKEQKPKIVYYE